jgi:16S rRNA (guanine527-N7)-methyltransferase
MAVKPRPALSPEGFQDLTGVSDETLARLTAYVELLGKWQRRINLVGRGTLADIWRRHVLDSAQLLPLVPADARAVLDLGSGAGFPGLVLAVMGTAPVQLVERNSRKCAFLREVVRATEAAASVHNCRIEDLKPFAADVITARAVAPLEKLLAHTRPFLAGGGLCLFLKGRTAQRELTDSAKNWMMTVTRIDSISDPSGVILKLEDISPRHG